MSRIHGLRPERSVRAFDARDFAEKHPTVLIHDHHAVLAADEQSLVRRIGNDVIPAAIPAERKGLG
jgi:hypothetical protein